MSSQTELQLVNEMNVRAQYHIPLRLTAIQCDPRTVFKRVHKQGVHSRKMLHHKREIAGQTSHTRER